MMSLFLTMSKLKYKAFYRGCKEIELLMREFFNEHCDTLLKEDCFLLEEFLETDDFLLLDYIYGRKDFEEDLLQKNNKFLKLFVEKFLQI